MYLWKTKALINDLRNEQVTQKEQVKYFLLVAVIEMAMPHRVSWFTVLDIIIFLVGIFLCYEANSKGDNKDFIVRLTCLNIPISFRILVPGFIFEICMILLLKSFAPNLSEEVLIDIPTSIIWIPYFYLLRSAILQVSEIHD